MFRKTSIICLEVVLGIAVVLGLLGAVSAWRLSQGPVSIRFLLPYAEDLLHRTDSPFQARLDDLILTWAGWERALDVRAVGVRLIASDSGRSAARIGEVSVSLSFRALVRGKVAPTSLEVIRPLIRLSRAENGAFRFGFGEADSAADEGGEDLLTPLLDELSRPTGSSEGSLRYLNRVSVVGAVLRVRDRKLGITWGARHADLTAERAPIGLRATFDLTADLKTSRPEIDGEAYFDRNERVIDIAASFEKANPSKLAGKFDALSALRPLDTELSGDIDLRLGLDGDVKRAKFALAAPGGTLAYGAAGSPPFRFGDAKLDGLLNRNPDQIRIAGLAIELEGVKANLKGVLTRVGDVAAINATVDVPEMPVNDVQKLWRPGMADGARDWVIANMRDGAVSNATASLTARIALDGRNRGSVEIDSVNGRFGVSGVTVDYLNPMPPITDAGATATFSTKRFDFAVHRGRVGDLEIEEGVVNITDIGEPREMLGLGALLRGPVSSAFALVAHPRLSLLSRVGLSTEGVTGTHATRLRIDFPLLAGVKAEEVRVSATSNIDGLSLSDVLKDRGISNGRVALSVDNNGMTARGTASYVDTPVEFEWTEDFSGANDSKRRLQAAMTTTETLRAVFDLDYRDILEGPVPVKVIYEERRDDTAVLSAGLNLQDAKFSLPGFDWAKLPGRPGTARATATFRENAIRSIPMFNIEAGDFSAAGKLTFAPSEPEQTLPIQTLRIEKFELGSTKFAVDARRDENLTYRIDLSGSGFDAAPFVGQDLAGVDAPSLPPFELTGQIEKFWIGPGPATNNVRMKLRHDGVRWQHIDIGGALPDGGKAIEIRMIPIDGGHELALYSADAGVLLKALDVTDTIQGGTIEISGIRKGGADAPWNGTAEMKRFRVADAPNLARLLTLASLTGIGNVIAGKGIDFDRLRFPFSFENETATITDGQAVGSELGITATGKVDFGKDAIDINGTIVPAYTINSLLGRIPVIGSLLTGEKGGGIFAATYKIAGPVEKPVMTVNPLSALAPGFLRKLLGEGAGQNEGKTPSQEERLREQKTNGGAAPP